VPALGPRPITDSVITIRSPRPGDTEFLIAGRDGESTRRLGPEVADPEPTACIVVGAEVVGWVDYDLDRDWLEPEEVNIGYCLFPPHRGCGYATPAVQLLMHHLAQQGTFRTATLLIDPTTGSPFEWPSAPFFPSVVPSMASTTSNGRFRRVRTQTGL
jgi:hypothetical protein